MPKLKTNRAAKKRFKITAKKKVLHKKANKSHILTKKSSKRIRQLGKKAELSPADLKKVKKMLPYDF
ncbi:MAG TPA: 50S ribosomal protein L35 [Candidatus Saccharicenans sp.]|nr:50S ribosomal protein L35 [Candidatus Saccharicenans sp.]HNT00733.1 50S ribosomal protein L35 [Candidatus Saccharicenans sp.]HPB59220.1 50S ribosomal protein L35 [Candidatus Saccharicenans sp.]HQO75738.1 50S ribosomal protein L35 [Candidatus Saccharicenans sp.]HUM79490.1 50S ribosomal protein L35 [Candidatus Saccharicenans sp.]